MAKVYFRPWTGTKLVVVMIMDIEVSSFCELVSIGKSSSINICLEIKRKMTTSDIATLRIVGTSICFVMWSASSSKTECSQKC
jgi:hypothetical protein